MTDGRPRATRPLTLFQGERGFAIYIPVADAGSLGYLNAVFDAQRLIESCFSKKLDETSYRVSDSGSLLYESPSFAARASRTSTAHLQVLDRTWQLDVRLREPNGAPSHWWVHLLSVMFAAGVAAAVHFALRRAEEREREERERRRLAERLQDANKLEAVGQLAGGVAHDFNNLLTVVASNVALLQEAALDAPARGAVDEIEAAAGRGAELTTQLLEFSRKKVVQARAVDVDAALTRAAGMFRRVLRESIQLELELEANQQKHVLIDPGQLDRALLNLALNAGDAMPDGGKLTLRSYLRGGRIWLEIADTGHGMSEAILSRAFEPFFTTKPTGKGTGLGLSTVYGVVSQAGGEVAVESKAGRGTTFRIWLPATAHIPEETSPAPPSSRTDTGGQKHVLLVEDDPGVRRGAARALRRAGYSVVEASNGVEALEKWSEEVDALVTDAVMPELGGKALIETLRKKQPRLAVVLMSGHAPEVLGDVLGRLDVVYLPKPYGPSDLVDALRTALLTQLPGDATRSA
ncbi:MAG: response regulator [Myxococcales bacterium]|nr:response regulator [Myxococcales bacterium]